MRATALVTAFLITAFGPTFASVVNVPLTGGTLQISEVGHQTPYEGFIYAYGVNNGFGFTTSGVYNDDGNLYLHDDFGALRSDIWNVDGRRFTPLSIVLGGRDRIKRSGSGSPDGRDYEEWATEGIPAHPGLFLYGMRDGLVVVETEVLRDEYGLFLFDSSFANIDQLAIRVVLPDGAEHYSDPHGPNALWCREWCVDYGARNLTLELPDQPTPVPLPATGTVLALGLFGLTRLRRRA